MKLTTYFVKHPVVAVILNAMIILLGLLCFQTVSVREYPGVQLPIFMVSAIYPNASPELVENAVTNILEEEFSGIEGVEIMSSTSNYGVSNIKLTFKEGFKVDKALNALREAVSLARVKLPKEVKDPRVQRKVDNNGPPFIAIALSSDVYNFAELTHYVNLYLKNAFRSLEGVASVNVWGQPYTMQVTLSQEKLHEMNIDAEKVYKVLAASDLSLPVGKFQDKTPVSLDIGLSSATDFSNLIIGEYNGFPVYLSSVARVTLEKSASSTRVRMNQEPGIALAITRASDANPVEVSKRVYAELARIKQNLPESINIRVALDKSNIIQSSLRNIRSSVFEAVILVLIIVFLFLRSFPATLVPLVTIPISLIGSLIFVKFLGFSINTLTLLAMVLAIGLVVDDAIVVIENIMRHIEKGLSPFNAALKGAKEIGFAVVAMTVTLASVYAPIMFIQGAIGQLFIEFAVVLAGSVIISGVVALTLSPVMCANIIKPNTVRLFPQVDRVLVYIQKSYTNLLNKTLQYSKLVWGTVIVVFLGIGFLYYVIPSETAPKEDRSLIGVYLPMIPNIDLDTFEQKVIEVESLIGNISEAREVFTFLGTWGASIIYPLKPHNERKRTATEIVESLRNITKTLPSMDAWPWSWDSGLPGVEEVTASSKVTMAVSTVDSYQALYTIVDNAKKQLEANGYFNTVNHDLKLDYPGYKINLDYNTMVKLGLSTTQVAKIIEVFFSGDKSLSFIKDGFKYPIAIQALKRPWSLNEVYASKTSGTPISIGTFANLEETVEARTLRHYNQMRTVLLSGIMDNGQQIAASMQAMNTVVAPLFEEGIKVSWIGAAKAYLESSHTMYWLFLMALVFIYAILAVQFESFIDPFIILFTVPLACLGALLALYSFSGTFNIYTQIGLITLIGLITKHGILMVEFANQSLEKGLKLDDAIKEAANIRLRPILMTTGAMVLGAFPLILATGAGAEARHAIGYVLVGGLLIGTLFTLFVLPVVYQSIKLRALKN